MLLSMGRKLIFVAMIINLKEMSLKRIVNIEIRGNWMLVNVAVVQFNFAVFRAWQRGLGFIRKVIRKYEFRKVAELLNGLCSSCYFECECGVEWLIESCRGWQQQRRSKQQCNWVSVHLRKSLNVRRHSCDLSFLSANSTGLFLATLKQTDRDVTQWREVEGWRVNTKRFYCN